MAVSITGRLLLQLLLLFLASHVGDLTEAAQIIQLIDDANQSHHVVGTGHNFSTTAGSQPHVESDAHSNLSINSSSATAPNSRSLLTTNSFTCPQAFFIFGDSLSDTGNVQFVFSGYNQSILNYPYGESYNFTEPGRDRFCDGRLLIDFLGKISYWMYIKIFNSSPSTQSNPIPSHSPNCIICVLWYLIMCKGSDHVHVFLVVVGLQHKPLVSHFLNPLHYSCTLHWLLITLMVSTLLMREQQLDPTLPWSLSSCSFSLTSSLSIRQQFSTLHVSSAYNKLPKIYTSSRIWKYVNWSLLHV